MNNLIEFEIFRRLKQSDHPLLPFFRKTNCLITAYIDLTSNQRDRLNVFLKSTAASLKPIVPHISIESIEFIYKQIRVFGNNFVAQHEENQWKRFKDSKFSLIPQFNLSLALELIKRENSSFRTQLFIFLRMYRFQLSLDYPEIFQPKSKAS